MKNELSSLWVHLIWCTHNRRPFLTPTIRPALLQHIREYAAAQGYALDRINATVDHVHCLVRMRPNQTISVFVGLVKGESAHWVNIQALTPSHFAWQPKFSALSVGRSELDDLRCYIDEQEERHATMTVAEEMERIYRDHRVEGPPVP